MGETAGRLADFTIITSDNQGGRIGADYGSDRGWAAWRIVCGEKPSYIKIADPEGGSGICRFNGREKGYYCFSRKRTRVIRRSKESERGNMQLFPSICTAKAG